MAEVSSSGYVYTDEEMKVYNQERMSIYRGTITVCIIYAVIAFILILIGYFTDWGREFLLGTILPFVITYIIGTIVVIIILADWVSKYQPRKIDDRIGYDNDICPDYWHLTSVDPSIDSTVYSSNVNENLMKYKCVMDPNILNKVDINAADTAVDDKYHFTNSIDLNTYNSSVPNVSHLYVDLNQDPNIANNLFGSDANSKFPEFKKHAAYMINHEVHTEGDDPNHFKPLETDPNKKVELYDPNSPDKAPFDTIGPSGKPMPLVCDTVYPLYLSAIDIQNSEINRSDSKNVYRCAYAKACGVPWTEAGCK